MEILLLPWAWKPMIERIRGIELMRTSPATSRVRNGRHHRRKISSDFCNPGTNVGRGWFHRIQSLEWRQQVRIYSTSNWKTEPVWSFTLQQNLPEDPSQKHSITLCNMQCWHGILGCKCSSDSFWRDLQGNPCAHASVKEVIKWLDFKQILHLVKTLKVNEWMAIWGKCLSEISHGWKKSVCFGLLWKFQIFHGAIAQEGQKTTPSHRCKAWYEREPVRECYPYHESEEEWWNEISTNTGKNLVMLRSALRIFHCCYIYSWHTRWHPW